MPRAEFGPAGKGDAARRRVGFAPLGGWSRLRGPLGVIGEHRGGLLRERGRVIGIVGRGRGKQRDRSGKAEKPRFLHRHLQGGLIAHGAVGVERRPYRGGGRVELIAERADPGGELIDVRARVWRPGHGQIARIERTAARQGAPYGSCELKRISDVELAVSKAAGRCGQQGHLHARSGPGGRVLTERHPAEIVDELSGLVGQGHEVERSQAEIYDGLDDRSDPVDRRGRVWIHDLDRCDHRRWIRQDALDPARKLRVELRSRRLTPWTGGRLRRAGDQTVGDRTPGARGRQKLEFGHGQIAIRCR